MRLVANALTGLVALGHVGFLILAMFFWDHPVGRPPVSSGAWRRADATSPCSSSAAW